MLLFISENVINTSWLILPIPKGKTSIILVLQQGIVKKRKRKEKKQINLPKAPPQVNGWACEGQWRLRS